MGRRALIRSGVAAAVSFTLAVGLGPLPAGTAHAEPVPGEVVVPPAITLQFQTSLLSAGPSGFLRFEAGLGHLWTSYAGVDTELDMSFEDAHLIPDFGAGSDVVADYRLSTRTVTLRDMSTGRSRTVTLPRGHDYFTTLGWTVVTRTESVSDPDYNWLLYDTHDDGSVTQRAVADVPDGIAGTSEIHAPLGDAHGQVVQYRIGTTAHVGWLDVDQGRLIPLPYSKWVGQGSVVLTSTHLLWWQDGVVSIHSRDDLTATPRRVPLTGDAQLLGMVGETLVVGRHDPSLGRFNYQLPVWRVDAVALDGSTVGTLLARSQGLPMPTPDGGLLVQGGPTPDEWGVSLVEAAAAGEVTIRRIAEAYPRRIPAVSALSFTQGRLNTLEYDAAQDRRHLYTREIGVTGSLTVGTRTARGPAPASCDSETCPAFHDTGDGRTVISGLKYPRLDDDRQPRLLEPTQPMPGTRIDGSRTYHGVAAVHGRFAALLPENTGTWEDTRVVDLDTGVTVLTTSAHVLAMWGTTLWVSDGNESAVPIDILTGQRGARVWFGSGCFLDEFQAVGRWLLWGCTGFAPGQGVYDTVTKTKLTLVSGIHWERGKLGDGFLVSPANGQLMVTDFRSGTPVSHTVGPFVWRSWDLDPYTGVIAHLAADGGVQLIPSGVPVSPLVQLDATVAASAHVKGDGTGKWHPKWRLSKPAASWTLVIRNAATGKPVRTVSGGLARGLVTTTWDGKDDHRRLVPNGAYTWTLTATPADGQGTALTRSGTLDFSHQCQIWNRPRAGAIGCS